MNRVLLVAGICAWLCAGGAEGMGWPLRARPNIVLILADDYGIDGVGCYGSDRFSGKTPHIDALAAGGIRFERCYSAPLCGPTRCLLTTGRYAFRTGALCNRPTKRVPSAAEPSVAKVLKDAGYATGMAGKWKQMSESPADWGYGEYLTDPKPGGYFWEKEYARNGKKIESETEFYYPDLAHGFALEFIRKHARGPFFFYYSTHLVHGPIVRTPDTKQGTADPVALYDDNVAYLDKQVGGLVAELDALGLRERTLILFAGDNGTSRESGTIRGRRVNGCKGTMLEGGARVPLIANWKGTAPAGWVLRDLVDFSDFFPTLAELAGARMPGGVVFDGRSFAPRLRGEAGDPREWVFVQLRENWYVRDDGWKLNQAGELFDMSDSPFVEAPVGDESRDPRAAVARRRLGAVLAQLDPAGGKTVSRSEGTRDDEE